jgi:hypothetical protein
MDRPSKKVHELENAILEFIDSFEGVFQHDWDMTKECITDELFINKKGNFIDPKVNDESNNWANRGHLLNRYRDLKKILESYGLELDDE